MSSKPRIFSIAAPSGTGKTTLITRLLEHLRTRGVRVGAVKSDAHGVDLDTEGKDTHRMRSAGAETTGLISRDQIAIFRDPAKPEVSLEKLIDLFFSDLDIVIAEGFRSHGFPTVVVRRTGIDRSGWKMPADVIASVVDDEEIRIEGLPAFAFDDLEKLASFLLDYDGE